MKSIKLIASLMSGMFLISTLAFAHGKGQGKGNKGKGNDKTVVVVKEKGKGPPPWAPAHGYRKRHIYFPGHNCYFDNIKGLYIFMDKGKWLTSPEIPLPLMGLDLKVIKKVELDLDDNVLEPHKFFKDHLKLFPADK